MKVVEFLSENFIESLTKNRLTLRDLRRILNKVKKEIIPDTLCYKLLYRQNLYRQDEDYYLEITHKKFDFIHEYSLNKNKLDEQIDYLISLYT